MWASRVRVRKCMCSGWAWPHEPIFAIPGRGDRWACLEFGATFAPRLGAWHEVAGEPMSVNDAGAVELPVRGGRS